MPWCPNCRTEYEAGIEKCGDCGSLLVGELNSLETEMAAEDHGVFLITAGDEIEADRIESLLNSNNIPVLRKYRETGAYLSIYMGNASYGIDIFVPSEQYDAAKELVLPIDVPVEKLSQDEDNAFKSEEKKVIRKRVVRAWIVLLFLVPGLLIAALALWALFFR